VDSCVALAAAEIPVLLSRIPPAPAANLGWLGAAEAPALGSTSHAIDTMRRLAASDPSFAAAPPARPVERNGPDGPSALLALRSWGPLPSERLLGALELTVCARSGRPRRS
jgi:hypothetical protein